MISTVHQGQGLKDQAGGYRAWLDRHVSAEYCLHIIAGREVVKALECQEFTEPPSRITAGDYQLIMAGMVRGLRISTVQAPVVPATKAFGVLVAHKKTAGRRLCGLRWLLVSACDQSLLQGIVLLRRTRGNRSVRLDMKLISVGDDFNSRPTPASKFEKSPPGAIRNYKLGKNPFINL